MKVLQINTIYKNKSTGRTCWELEKKLIEQGHECVTAFGHGDNYGENTYRINSYPEYAIHNILSKATGLEGYFSYFATKRLIRFMKKYSPDIVHLRNLHGHYLNLPLFFKYLKKTQIPVVMNLHDCWILTGKCCHPTYHSCDGWLNECKNCPARAEYPVSWHFDFSRMMFKHKKKWFSQLEKCVVVGVSNWIAGEGEKSHLGKFPVKYVYNWIDTEAFHPYEGVKKSDFGLCDDKFTVICAGAVWRDDDTKTEDLIRLADKLDNNTQILLVGSAKENLNHPKIIKAGFTNNTETLAKMYSASDVYVHFSTADTFGKVIAESMACGTPAIVYNVTACPELVAEGCGASVDLHDIDGIVEKINEIRESGKESYSQKCVERVKNNFNYEKNVQQTIEIYKELLK